MLSDISKTGENMTGLSYISQLLIVTLGLFGGEPGPKKLVISSPAEISPDVMPISEKMILESQKDRADHVRITSLPENTVLRHRENYSEYQLARKNGRTHSVITVNSANSFKQIFTCREDGMSGLSFKIDGSGRDSGLFVFRLTDSIGGNTVYHEVFKAHGAPGGTVSFYFTPQLQSEDRSYTAEIEASKLNPEAEIYVRYSYGNTSGARLSSGSKFVQGSALMSIQYLEEVKFYTETSGERSEGIDVSTEYVLLNGVKPGSSSISRMLLYSVDKGRPVYACDIKTLTESDANKSLCGMMGIISGYASGASFPGIGSVQASSGDSAGDVFITWKAESDSDFSCILYRSSSFDGPYEAIGSSTSSSYIDRSAGSGKCWWYRIQPIRGSVSGNPAGPFLGYANIIPKKTITLDGIISEKNKKPSVPESEIERRREKRMISFLNEYLFGSIKMRILMFTASPYLSRPEAIIVKGDDDFTLDFNSRTVQFKTPDQSVLVFHSKKLFSLINKASSLNEVKEKITFGHKGNFASFEASGWRSGGPSFSYVEKSSAVIKVPLRKRYTSLTGEIELIPNGNPLIAASFLSISINGRVVEDLRVFGKNRIRFTVNGLADEEALLLEFGFDKKALAAGHKPVKVRTLSLISTLNDEPLIKRLIANGFFFGIHEGYIQEPQEGGTLNLLPVIKSAGLVTQFYRDSKEWRSEALVFSSGDKELVKKLKKMKEDN